MEELPRINLVLAEDLPYSIDARMKVLSGLLSNILEDSNSDEEIPLKQIKVEYLREIIEYAEHHNYTEPEGITCPIPTADIRDAVKDPWDADFVSKFDDDSLSELTNTANYLDIRCLLDLCCGTIASRFKGKDVGMLRNDFGISDDFTPEEEEKVMEQFPWILERDEEQLLSAQKRAVPDK